MTLAAPSRPRSVAPGASTVATGVLVESLESALSGLIAEHEGLAELARAQRAAIGAADAGALEGIVREQRRRMRAVAELDARRHEAAAALAARYGVARQGGGPTVSMIAAAMPGPGSERLRGLAERLRGVLAALRQEHAVVRSAAETVFAHIDGMMQQLSRRLSQTATYSRPGAGAAPASFASALDLTT